MSYEPQKIMCDKCKQGGFDPGQVYSNVGVEFAMLPGCSIVPGEATTLGLKYQHICRPCRISLEQKFLRLLQQVRQAFREESNGLSSIQ